MSIDNQKDRAERKFSPLIAPEAVSCDGTIEATKINYGTIKAAKINPCCPAGRSCPLQAEGEHSRNLDR